MRGNSNAGESSEGRVAELPKRITIGLSPERHGELLRSLSKVSRYKIGEHILHLAELGAIHVRRQGQSDGLLTNLGGPQATATAPPRTPDRTSAPERRPAPGNESPAARPSRPAPSKIGVALSSLSLDPASRELEG